MDDGRDPFSIEETLVRRFLRIFIPYFLFPALASICALLIVYHFVLKPRIEVEEDKLAWIVDASTLIRDRYVEEVGDDRLAWEAIKGMASGLDPYSDFVDPSEYAKYREEAEGQYVGVGFVIYRDGPPVTVLYPFPGSPAERAGLDTGDRILAVDGESCEGQDSEEIVKKIKNLPGTPVTLRIRPFGADASGNSDRDLTIVREMIETPSVFDPRIVDREHGIGYVRIADFHANTTDELVAALQSLDAEGMKSLVLDLRRNRGGLLTQAISVASLFLEDKVVVRTEGRTEESNVVYPTERQLRDGKHIQWYRLPLTVLVDTGTASASEIVAGALQDHLRGTLVGERTFGKGMVQTQIPRRYGDENSDQVAILKITTARYLTPSGRAIEARFGFDDHPRRGGLIPDFPLLLDRDDAEDLDRHLADREIKASTWTKIGARCPKTTKIRDGKYRDLQLDRAVDALRGAPTFQKVY